MTIFAPSAASVWRQLEDAGLDPAPLFSKHGIAASAIFDPNARISLTRIDRVVAEAVQKTQDPIFGMREAEYFLPTHIGPLGFAWLASANLREAFNRLQRYSRAINDNLSIEVSEVSGGSSVFVSFDAPSLEPFHRDIGSLAVLAKMCRFVCGDDWSPHSVAIAYPAPADTSSFFSYYRCPVEFGAAINSLTVSTAQLEQRITGANAHLAQLSDHIVVRYLAHRSREDIVNRTRAAILDSLGNGDATELSVADRLHLSPRQLNRKLKEQDSSFRSLLVECRLELAEQYISDSTLSLTEISFLLGFAEPSSFSRAYRRWTGVSPTQARADS